MSFHVGQRVVCVDDKSPAVSWSGDLSWPTEGQIYTISWAGICPRFNKQAVQLAEFPTVTDDGRNIRYQAKRFRPVKETNISIFTAMLSPAPKQKVRA